jgi:flavorubredoxin
VLARKIKDRIYWMGAVDWDRRLFDSLIPLPDGTTYNAYLIEGSEKTALLDTVDPPMVDILMAQLDKVPKIDFIVSHHAEQDHSGTIPRVLDRFQEAEVVSTSKAKTMLIDLLGIPEDAFITVADIGKLAMALVDAATIVVGTPTVLAGPHPLAAYSAFLANALRPKTKFLSIIGSYGWGGKTVETLAGMIPNLKVDVINPVLCKGLPSDDTFKALDELAATIAEKHQEHGFT